MKVLFAAGGTGGHINPALSVAQELKKRCPDADILFVGTADKMESKLVPAAGFDFTTIKISGFQRKITIKNIFRNIQTIVYLMLSFFQVRKLLKEFKPDAVIGFGGYVSGPVVRAAAKKGIKTLIHEQNAYPGIANKALAKLVDKTLLTVEDASKLMSPKNKPIVTGLPIRDEIINADKETARKKLGLDDKPLIFSTGGSLGARTINEVMVELIVAKHKDEVHFVHGYGQYGKWVPERLSQKGVDLTAENIDVREYIYDMADCLAAADIVISRAGASSLSEIQALGKTAILIPSPNVAENHQYHNAMALVNNDAAIVFEEKDLTANKLIDAVNDLLNDREKLARIGFNAKKMAKLDAKEKICNEILE